MGEENPPLKLTGMDDLLSLGKNNSIIEKKGEVILMAKAIRKDIMEDVKEYLLLDQQVKAGEKRLRELRKRIEPYMGERELNNIVTEVGSIVIVPQPRAIMSARFTTYEIDDLLKVASPDAVSMCIVEKVDREAVDYLVSTKVIPKDVENYKQMLISPCFSVKPSFSEKAI